MDPATHGIIERDVVGCDQGAAGRRGAQPAEADALRGGIGDQRRRAAEQLDPGKRAHLSVHGDGRGGLQIDALKRARGDGTFERAERFPIGCDGDHFSRGSGFHLDGGIGADLDVLAGESFGVDTQLARDFAIEGEASAGIGAAEQRASSLFYRGSGQRCPRVVFHSKRQRHRRARFKRRGKGQYRRRDQNGRINQRA